MERPNLLREVQVSEYPILIGRHLLQDAEMLQDLATSQVLIVSNETIAPLYLEAVQRAFSAIQCDTILLPDGEQYKVQASINRIHETLLNNHHTRQTTLIALGGGVIGDMAGFAASTYHRGVEYIQLPTTLLAAVDAAVGGKTAINMQGVKNAIGTFHQPKAVIIDLETFKTLPEREFQAGFGEIIKYGLIEGGDFFERILEEELSTLVEKCCEIKGLIVKEDAYDQTGLRAVLNLGHTFAHALEAYTNYERFLHGEAVGVGLYCAALLSHKKGLISDTLVHQIDALLKKSKLPRRIPQEAISDVDKLYSCMLQDKKREAASLPFVLIRAPGDCFLEREVSKTDVIDVLRLAIGADIN